MSQWEFTRNHAEFVELISMIKQPVGRMFTSILDRPDEVPEEAIAYINAEYGEGIFQVEDEAWSIGGKYGTLIEFLQE